MDFVALCRAARASPGLETSDRLWSAWFALPTWHFLAAASPSGPLPFSSFVNRQRCVLAFTSAATRRTQAGPPMDLTPEMAMPRLQLVRSYGVSGFVVDVGPDGFHTSLDQLAAMVSRFRPRTIAWWLAQPAWHLAMTTADPTVPDLADRDGELIAQIYSTHTSTRLAMPPRQVLGLLADLELVKYVRFDDQLVVDLIDLGLAARP
jgi:hypothetical protein